MEPSRDGHLEPQRGGALDPKSGSAVVDSGRLRTELEVAHWSGVSLRRFLGWEPTERHEHFDADGNLTGTTVVRRESEWDDEARSQAFEAWEYERLTRRCGHHPSTAFDSTHGRLVDHERMVCEDCRAVDQAREKWHLEQGHPSKGPCPCDDEVFWISDRAEL